MLILKKLVSNKALNLNTYLIKYFDLKSRTLFVTKMVDNQVNDKKALIEKGKKAAAYMAIDENVNKNVQVIGIGSGSTIVYAVERLAEKVQKENLDITCIPTSFQSKQLLLNHKLRVNDLEACSSIDLTIDGADECDKDLICIKGGGGCHLQEKLVAYAAKNFIVIADIRKRSNKLGQNWNHGIPIEVFPPAYKVVQNAIENLYGGKAELREYQGESKAKAGPIITDNGNFIIDWKFETKDDNDNVNYDWKTINTGIKMIPGVVETGLFIGMTKIAYFGNLDGTVVKLEKS